MSVRNKVSAVNAIQYHPQLKRFIAEGNDDTLSGFFTNRNLAWVVNGGKLAIIDALRGCPRPVHEFGESCKDPFYVTCVEELFVSCSSPTPLLLVGISSLYHSQICVYNPATAKVLRAIQIKDIQIRCMTIVDNGTSCLNSLTDVLSNMDGVIAVGCTDGSVVLIDLNRQQLMKAHHGNALYRSTECSPQQVKFVNLDCQEEEAAVSEIIEIRRNGMSAAITIIEGDSKDTEFGVTALSFSKETACLYIGYSSGLWQIWNLSFPTFSVLYECAECTSPVSNFCQIEPCEDPRPTLYLWVNHEGTETSKPLFNMYSMCYSSKHHISDYGPYYQDFVSCSLSFCMSPGEDCGNVISGKLVSSASYSKNIKRSILHNMGLPEMEGIQMKLVVTAYSLTYARGSTHTFLSVFDLDQWYKEQMPPEPDVESSYVEIIELSSEPLLTSSLLVDSFSLYHSDEPQEIHLVPRALSFKVVGLSATSVVLFEKIGLQHLWLSNTKVVGAKSLISPSKLFHACVTAGFTPSFPVDHNMETSSPENEEMRSFILSVCLDNGRTNVILEAAELWETGAYAGSNCTLNFLFDWAWSSVSSAYKSFTDICQTLFSSSSDIDVSLKRRMQHSRLVLDWLHFIYVSFWCKYNNPLYKDTLEQRIKTLEIINLFVHQVSWFMNVGLLPESTSSKGSPNAEVTYNYPKINHFAVERREYLNNLTTTLKKRGSVHEVPGAGLYLADSLIHDYNEIGSQWDDEGGTPAYPPPSIQSLLRSLRLQSVPVSRKLATVLYTLLDLANAVDKEHNETLISKVETFHLLPQVTDGQTNAIKGLWHLDHSLYEEGVQYLFHHTITSVDISESLHRSILHLLYIEGKANLALQYLRLKKPSLTLSDDLKLEMSILLARDLVNEAYYFQKKHTFLREALFRQLLSECLVSGNIGKVISLPLDDYELAFFDHYLEKNRNQRNDDLRILLLLSRSKYNEAKLLHERLRALNRKQDVLQLSNRDLIVKGFTHSLCSVSRDTYLQKLDPTLKTLPEFKSSKPRPLSVYVKTVDDKGFPNFLLPMKKLAASAVAAAVNLRQFVGRDRHSIDQQWESSDKASEKSQSVSGSGELIEVGSRKRSAAWFPGGNKRIKMDDNAIARDESIAAFVGTPLVKRRSKETLPETPHGGLLLTQVHSILKSGKTPAGTPAKPETASNEDEFETPKKTLRWNIPSDTAGKDRARKSHLSTSIQSDAKESTLSHKVNDTPKTQEAEIQTPESIKSRLRSHSATSKKEASNWAEIAEETQSKVLFAVNSTSAKSTLAQKELPTRKRLNSAQRKIWEKKADEKVKLPETSQVFYEKMDDETATTEDEDSNDVKTSIAVEAKETPKAASKHLRFMDITIGSDEVSLLDISGSPFTTTVLPRELREELRAKELASSQQKSYKQISSDSVTPSAEPSQRISSAVNVAQANVEPLLTYQSETNFEGLQPKLSARLDENEVPAPKTPSLESPKLVTGISASTKITGQLSSEQVVITEISVHEHDANQKDVADEVEDGKIGNAAKETSSVFVPQHLPEIPPVVSLSRGHYPEDEDEEESEDPEEAEIPPAIEFAQPEEGLVIDATFSCAGEEMPTAEEDSQSTSNEDSNKVEGGSNLSAPSAIPESKDDDSGSSVICLDSDSDNEQSTTRMEALNYDDYDESFNSTSRSRSFFHDKYSSKPAPEEEERSQDYYSEEEGEEEDDDEDEDDEEDEKDVEEGDRDSSDVDLYNMDNEDNEDEEKPDDLESEIFGLHGGLQKKDDPQSDSGSGEDEDEDEGEEDEDDPVESDCQSDSGNSIIPSSKASEGGVVMDDEAPEVISSDDSDKESSSSNASQSIQPAVDVPLEEQPLPSDPVGTDITEDEAAVNSMLLSVQSPQDDTEESNEQELPLETKFQDDSKHQEVTNSLSLVENPEEKPAAPEKPDVFDILNLSRGQMFFGSPLEAEKCNDTVEKALFQLGAPRAGDKPASDSNNEQSAPTDESPVDNSQDEQLVLQVNPEDVSCSEKELDAQWCEQDSPVKVSKSDEQREVPATGSNSISQLEVTSSEGDLKGKPAAADSETVRSHTMILEDISESSEDVESSTHQINTLSKAQPDDVTFTKGSLEAPAKIEKLPLSDQTFVIAPSASQSHSTENNAVTETPKPPSLEPTSISEAGVTEINDKPAHINDLTSFSKTELPPQTNDNAATADAESKTDHTTFEVIVTSQEVHIEPEASIPETASIVHGVSAGPEEVSVQEKVDPEPTSLCRRSDQPKQPCTNDESGIGQVAVEPNVQNANSLACQTTQIEPLTAKSVTLDQKSFSCQADMDRTEIISRDKTIEAPLVSEKSLSGSSEVMDEGLEQSTVAETSTVEQKTVIIEPPTPFKNVATPNKTLIHDESNATGSNSSLLNPCDVAFVNDSTYPATPGTPSHTPARKSLRLMERMSTPGRCLVPDEDVNESYSLLDVALISDKSSSPLLVNRSMVTDKCGLTQGENKRGKAAASKIHSTAAHDGNDVVEKRRSRRSSSEPKTTENENADKNTHKKNDKSIVKTRRASSVEPVDDQRKPRRRSSVNLESTINSGENLKKSTKSGRNVRKSASPESADSATQHQGKGVQSTSLQPEDASRKSRQGSKEKSNSNNASSKSSQPSTSSEEKVNLGNVGSGSHIRRSAKHKRSSSVPPELSQIIEDEFNSTSVLASSEVSSRKRSSESLKKTRATSSSSLTLEQEVDVDPESSPFKRRKVKHSITEPLGKKKQPENPSQERNSLDSDQSTDHQINAQPSTSTTVSRRPRKSRSLHEYPVRRSTRRSGLESIEELPESFPQNDSETTSKGALSAAMKRWSTKPLDISSWLALASSQAPVPKRRSKKTEPPSFSDLLKFCYKDDPNASLQSTPPLPSNPREGEISPTSSVVSTASSKVLRSGRTIDENTPTKRGPKMSAKRRAAKLLQLSAQSPAKILRSGRSVGSEDGMSVASHSGDEEEDSSVNTSISSAVSTAEQESSTAGVTLEEMMSSRRLTRHQRSILERSMSSSRREERHSDK